MEMLVTVDASVCRNNMITRHDFQFWKSIIHHPFIKVCRLEIIAFGFLPSCTSSELTSCLGCVSKKDYSENPIIFISFLHCMLTAFFAMIVSENFNDK